MALDRTLNPTGRSRAIVYASTRIAPGPIDLPGGLWDKRKHTDPDLYRRTVESIPLGAMGSPQDVAGAILFLASAYGRWITGQTLLVDGGQSLV